jgi:hypothetical protein
MSRQEDRVTAEELLRVYDIEVRASFADRLPAGWSGEQDGPLTRCVMPRGGFAMFTADARGLSRDELVALVDRTFAYYAERGLEFEWKTFDHDRPDLIPLLMERGSVPEPHEALIMGSASTLAEQPQLPIGLIITSAVDRADLERIAELMSAVWDEDRAWVADDLDERLRSTEPIEVLVVRDGDLVVSAAWLVPVPGTRVAGLWGGSTRAAYRGRGCYRALVARRAQIALERGYSILQVDASDDSRPILERLGLQVVGGTTPYVKPAEKA